MTLSTPTTSATDRFWSKVRVEPAHCWEWVGASNRGRGVFRPGGSAPNVYASRFVYELVVGSIPEGYEVDHRCRNVRCVRPDHLEAVTPEINKARRVYTPHQMRCAGNHDPLLVMDKEGRCKTCRAKQRRDARHKSGDTETSQQYDTLHPRFGES